MAFNVSNFRAQGLVLGGARPSLFQIEMSLPAGVGAPNAAGRVPFLARAGQIPAATVDPVEVPYFGRKIKYAGDRTFADWTVTVMNDEDFQLRAMFENWSNRINSLVGNISATGPQLIAGYKATATVTQYGREGNPLRQYLFNGIFPTTVDAIALDWDNTNAIETFDITFAYDWWEPIKITAEAEAINIGVGGAA